VENGILYRNPYQMSPPRYEYRLTDKGLDLYPVILSVWNWDTRWGSGSESHPALVHKRCGHAMQAEFRCSACAEPITMYSVRFVPGEPDSKSAAVPARFQRDVGPTDTFRVRRCPGPRYVPSRATSAWQRHRPCSPGGQAVGEPEERHPGTSARLPSSW